MLLITITCVLLVSLCSGVGTSLLDWPHHNASLRNDDIPWSSLEELSQLEASRHGLLQAILGDPEELPQISTVILRIRIGKVAWFAVYICGNFSLTQYMVKLSFRPLHT